VIRGVVNAYEQAAELLAADPGRYLAALPSEDELTAGSLAEAVTFAGRFESARLATHCLETHARREKVHASFGRSTIQVRQKAYGYADRGRVEPGAAADLVMLDLSALAPIVDRPELSTAAYAVLADTRPSCVRHVMIAGRAVLLDGEPAAVDAAVVARRRHEVVRRACG
jgi:cytosine/adenosine deaminase-related metal-dependent hydrolase